LPLVVIKSYRLSRRHLAAAAAAVLLLSVLPFFGRQAARYAESQKAARWAAVPAGFAVVVDAGHGGVDAGAIGPAGTREKDISLEVARLLAQNLRAAGVSVVMTREDDTDLSDPATAGAAAKKAQDLERRATLANDSGAALLVSVHTGSHTDPSRRGSRVFFQSGSDEGRRAAAFIAGELAGAVKNGAADPCEAEYYITKNTVMPAVVVEVGFITSPEEEKLLGDPSYRQKAARAISSGVLKYASQRAAGAGSGGEGAVGAFKKHTPPPALKP